MISSSFPVSGVFINGRQGRDHLVWPFVINETFSHMCDEGISLAHQHKALSWSPDIIILPHLWNFLPLKFSMPEK